MNQRHAFDAVPNEEDLSGRPHNAAELQLAAHLAENSLMGPPSHGHPHHSQEIHNDHITDSGLRNIISSNGQAGSGNNVETAYMESPDSHLAAAAAVAAVGQGQVDMSDIGGVANYGLGDASSARKRSKSSRACDECRRKKIKCDANPMTMDGHCSHCIRAKTQCMFSRIPQKRGPHKGYIRILAERISGIEDKLVLNSLKRTYDEVSEGGDGALGAEDATAAAIAAAATSAAAQAHGAWAVDTRLSSSLDASAANPSAATTAPSRELAAPPFPDPPSEMSRLSDLPTGGGAPLSSTSQQPTGTAQSTSTSTGLDDLDDEGVTGDVYVWNFDSYLQYIHETLPMLPLTSEVLRQQLEACRPRFRSAFVDIFYAATWSFDKEAGKPSGNILRSYLKLLMIDLSGPLDLSEVESLTLIQTLLLACVEMDNRPPAEYDSTKKGSLLSRAVSQALQSRLYEVASSVTARDPSTDDSYRARVWWSLVVMDRWFAVSQGQPFLIQSEFVRTPPSMASVLGTELYLLGRLQPALDMVIGSVSRWTRTLTEPSAGDVAYAKAIAPWLDRFREDLPDDVTAEAHLTIHLAYWHVRLLALLVDPEVAVSQVLWVCREVVQLATQTTSTRYRGPLHHHFVTLVALVLRLIWTSATLALHVDTDTNHESQATLGGLTMQQVQEETARLLLLFRSCVLRSSWTEMAREIPQQPTHAPTATTATAAQTQTQTQTAEVALPTASQDTASVEPSSRTAPPHELASGAGLLGLEQLANLATLGSLNTTFPHSGPGEASPAVVGTASGEQQQGGSAGQSVEAAGKPQSVYPALGLDPRYALRKGYLAALLAK